MDMHNERWIKEKYDYILENQLEHYIFLSLKIKHFRKINRLYGRDYGDRLIMNVFKRINAWIQPTDYVAHVYHGYFNLLLQKPDDVTDDYGYVRWIGKLGEYIYHVEDEHMHDNVFCGFGIYPLCNEPVDFYIAQYNADICRSESGERNFLISHIEIYGSSYHEEGLFAPNYRQMLKPAMEAGHIKMFLQPKVDMKTGEITHAEALVRWIDPEKGMLPIQEYLPLLEECGFANLIDMFIFENACKWIQTWIQTYQKHIHISVNISANTFVYPFFVDEIREVYNTFDNCPKECLELELLESIILNKIDRVKEVAHDIRGFGIGCSLDDFGSGYSSYNVIAQTPLTMLKIDRSIFRDHTNEKEHILIKRIIQTAHDLGLQVVAEGIETIEYAKFLKQNDCEYIQGFVYYRPMPVEEFEERFLINHEKIDVTFKD